MEKRVAGPTRSVLGLPVVYRFLRRSETLFVAAGKIALMQGALGLETGPARDDSGAQARFKGAAEPPFANAC